MKRIVLLLLLVAVLSGGVLYVALQGPEELPPPSDLADACTIRDERPGWYRATRAAARKWNVPPSTMLAIVWRESAFRAQARPPRKKGWWIFSGKPISTAYGFSQALDGTWGWYLDDTGAEDMRRDTYAHAIDFVGWYMDKSREKLGFSGLDAREHYLAYHQGHGGYRAGRWRRIGWLKKAAGDVEARARRYDEQLFDCDSLHAAERSLRDSAPPRTNPRRNWNTPVPARKPDPIPRVASLDAENRAATD
jgi:hypothetical protein